MRTILPSGLITVPALFLLASCSESVGPRDASVAPPAAEISDAVHTRSNAHFYLLPPLVKAPTYTGAFDPSLAPVVDVCEWTAAGCGRVVASFSTTSGTGGSTIKVDATSESYGVVWHTDQCIVGCPLDPAKTYRIRFRVLATELGHADVDVVARGSELRNVQTNEYIPLLAGRSLPIQFRIERGALFVATPSATQTQTFTTAPASDGSTVALSVPPGALGAPTALTIEPAAPGATPADSRLATATVYAFGPDGSTFATPLNVTMSYDPARLPVGTDQTRLRLFWTEHAADGSIVWRAVAGSRVDVAAHTVTGAVSHFSYGTIGTTSCTGTTPSPSEPISLEFRVPTPAAAVFCDDAGNSLSGREEWGAYDPNMIAANYDGSAWSLTGWTVGTTTVVATIYADYGTDTVSTSTDATVFAPSTAKMWMPHDVWVTLGEPAPFGVLFTASSNEIDSMRVATSAIGVDIDTSLATIGGVNDDEDPMKVATITATGVGNTRLTISIPGLTDSVSVHTTPVARVEARNPDGSLAQIDTIFAVGDTLPLTAVAYDVNDSTLPPGAGTWASSDPSIATVSGDGVVTAVAWGQVTITLWLDGRTYSFLLNVD